MRIDTYMQVSQLYNTNKAKKSVTSDRVSTSDSLEISDFGNAYQVAKQAAAQGTPVREDRVQDIKARLAAGTYNVSMEDVADRLADRLLA